MQDLARPCAGARTVRGSRYLRIQGARAALPSLTRTATPLGGWLRGLLARAHGNTVASKLSRIAWAITRNKTTPAAQQWRRRDRLAAITRRREPWRVEAAAQRA
jgi:hypothetical protein